MSPKYSHRLLVSMYCFWQIVLSVELRIVTATPGEQWKNRALSVDVRFAMKLICIYVIFKLYLITGPPTHSVGGQTSNGRWHSSSVVCNTAHMQRNSPGGSTRRASRVTSRYGDTFDSFYYSSVYYIMLSPPDSVGEGIIFILFHQYMVAKTHRHTHT